MTFRRQKNESQQFRHLPRCNTIATRLSQYPMQKRTRRTRCRRVLFVPFRDADDQAIAFTLLVRRENLRATVFLWSTPLATPRAISGCAAFSAVAAASLSPAATAVSTFFTSVRMRETRFLFTRVRAVLRRMRFFACGVLAINSSSLSNGLHGRSTAAAEQPNPAKCSESMSGCGRFRTTGPCSKGARIAMKGDLVNGLAGNIPHYRWHLEQKKVERPLCTIRAIVPLHSQASPSRP